MRLLKCGRFYDILYKNCNKGDLIMASFSMHLAIAKLYLKDHPEENEEEFLEGILEPDTVPSIEKGRTHYGLHAAWSNPAKYLQEKITERFGFTDFMVNNMGPVIGTHTGPTIVLAGYYGESRS